MTRDMTFDELLELAKRPNAKCPDCGRGLAISDRWTTHSRPGKMPGVVQDVETRPYHQPPECDWFKRMRI